MAGKQGYSCLSDGSGNVPSSSPEGTVSPHSPGLCLISPAIAETPWLSSAPPQPQSPSEVNVTLEELLAPITEKLKYLLKKAEDFQTYLLYSCGKHLPGCRDCVLSTASWLPAYDTFRKSAKMCQPYFHYLESTARSCTPYLRPPQEPVRRRLLEISQQLACQLEQLVLMYASFSFVSLEDTDPFSVSCFFCGKFWLNELRQLSIFRYCISAPYTAAHIPHNLYKKMRWNLDILEGPVGRNQTPRTEYYFLCFRDTGDETTVKIQKLWSIGRWVPVDPDNEHSSDVLSCLPSSSLMTEVLGSRALGLKVLLLNARLVNNKICFIKDLILAEDADLACITVTWLDKVGGVNLSHQVSGVLCRQPMGDYQQLLTIGFEEPSHTLATDLLVQMLNAQSSGLVSHESSCWVSPGEQVQ